MSHLLYLHSVAGDPKSKRKPLSEMGLGKPVLEAWAPRFKKAGAQAWLAMLLKDDGPVTLTPTRVGEFAAALVKVAALEAPPLKCGKADLDEFEQAFRDELLDPVSASAKKKLGLHAEWC